MSDINELNSIFETNKLFAGGSGLFVEYNDLVRLTGLTVIMKLIHVENFGFPTFLLEPLNDKSIVEWYMNRNNVNPLIALDYKNKLSYEEADKYYQQILDSDIDLYEAAPSSNIVSIFHAIKVMKCNTPIFIYNNEYNKHIELDIKNNFKPAKFIYGDLKKYLNKNYTYIFSNMNTLQRFLNISNNIFCHIIISSDFEYNFISDYELKYDKSMIRLNSFSYIQDESIVRWIEDLKKILSEDFLNL